MFALISPATMEQKRHPVLMGKHVITGVVAALLLVGCAQDPTLSPSPTTTSPTTSSSSAEEVLALYFVADTVQGPRLFREFQRVPVATSRIEAAVNAVLSGKPLDPDYLTLWPEDARVENVTRNGATATIDISFSALNVGAEFEQRAIDQIVWTATAAEPGITGIRLLRSGKEVESLAGHVDATATFKRGPHYDVLAPIWITSIQEGGTLTGDFTFTGLATVFEANVQWEIRQGDRIVKSGFTMASEGAPARAPWSVTVTGMPSGSYTLRAYANSMKDGSLFAEDTKEIFYTAP